MRWWLAALLLAVPAAAGSQLGGGAGHPGIHVPHEVALDILGPVDVWPEGKVGDLRLSPGLLPVAGGLRGAVGDPSGDGGCQLVDVLADGSSPRATPVPACDGSAGLPSLAVAEPGWNLLCRKAVPAFAPLLLAVDDAGQELWSLTATDLAGPTATGAAWSCMAAVLHDGTVVAAVVDWTPSAVLPELAGRNVVVGADPRDGAVRWQAEVTMAQMAGDGAGSQVNAPEAGPHPTFTPLSVTATETGYVVMGDLGGARAAVLLGPEGAYLETLHAAETPLGRPYTRLRGTVADETMDRALRSSLGSGWATASGSLAYVALGSEVMGLDPLAPRPVAVATPQLPYPFQPHAGLAPLLVGDRLVVPTQSGVVAVDRSSLQPVWDHRINPGTGYWMWDVAASAAGDVWIVGVGAGREEQVRAQRLASSDGRLLQDLALDLALGQDQITFDHTLLRIVPTPDGFLVVNKLGDGVRLGKAAPGLAPRLAASGLYPAPGEELRLDVATPVGTTTTVHWGDGLSDALQPGEAATKRYETAGDRTIRATTAYPDGRTATATLVVHVGGTPPPELTFLQKAFAPGRQDTTWGVIGIVVAFFGGIGAYAANAWRRRGVARQLRELDGLRARAAGEPLEALEGLRHFRWRLRGAVERGRIDGSQYASLLQETERLGRAIEVRLWGVLRGRLRPALSGAVEAALTDGHLSAAERAALQAELAGERRLSERERAAFARLIEGGGPGTAA